MSVWEEKTKVDVGAAKRARDDYGYQRRAEADPEYQRLVAHHIYAWATWDGRKTPRPEFVEDFEEQPTKEIRR